MDKIKNQKILSQLEKGDVVMKSTKLINIQLTLFVLLFAGLSLFAQSKFEAKLTGEQEVPAVTTEASGTAVFNLTAAGLEYLITINNMSMTAAHIHLGKIGVEGTVVKTLTTSFQGNTASGIWTSNDTEAFNETMLKALLKGELYVNIHSNEYPDGEIRGQIENASSTSFTALFKGSTETDIEGTGTFNLTSEGLKYSITTSGSNATNVEFYIGSQNTNGQLVGTFQIENNTAVGVWSKNDSEPLTEAVVEAMLKGNVKVVVNTDNEPMSGQVELDGGINLSAELSGENVEPSVETEASGTATLTLTSAGLVYKGVVDSAEITSVAFFEGEAGINGNMLKDVSLSVEGNSFVGVWTTSDNTTPLTAEIMAKIIEGNVYVQVNSDTHTEGELRGQIEFNSESSFNIDIENNVNNSTELVGVGSFMLTTDGLNYRVTVEGSKTTAINLMKDDGTGNGEVIAVFDTDAKVKTNTFVGVWSNSSILNAFTQAELEAMLKGEVWIELEEETVREGETKGYVKANADVSLNAELFPEQSTSEVSSLASGTASIKIVGDNAVYFVTVNGLEISAAHFHNAEIGVDGGVVKTISGDFENNTAIGVWSETNIEAFSDFMAEEMMKGNVYLNVHTSEYPSGEIRGQAQVKGGLGLKVETNGDNLVSPIETEAYGTGSFTLTSKGMIYDYSAENVNIVNVDLYYGAEGTVGPLAFTLTGDLSFNTALGVWLRNEIEGFSSGDMSALLKSETYLKIISDTHSEGEMRGQVTYVDEGNTIVSVEELGRDEELPTEIVLNQNYPNPFNPATTIGFAIPEKSDVTIEIYNILGQKVATVLKGEQNAGYHEVSFSADNYSSGIYLYTLTAGNKVLTKKMQLIK